MKYFQLEGIIEEPLLTRFMDFCNAYPDEDCTVVINSVGGKGILSSVIVAMINSNADRFILVSAGVYSAAFWIFFFAKCKRKIVKQSLGMYHKEYMKDVYINMDKKYVYQSDECQVENFKTCDESFLKTFMTPEETRRYNKSDDVYFTFKRMTEIFPDVEIIK